MCLPAGKSSEEKGAYKKLSIICPLTKFPFNIKKRENLVFACSLFLPQPGKKSHSCQALQDYSSHKTLLHVQLHGVFSGMNCILSGSTKSFQHARIMSPLSEQAKQRYSVQAALKDQQYNGEF